MERYVEVTCVTGCCTLEDASLVSPGSEGHHNYWHMIKMTDIAEVVYCKSLWTS